MRWARPHPAHCRAKYQLLPPSLSCEAAQFALCGNLEPSTALSGDTLDYTLSGDTLLPSATDTMITLRRVRGTS